MRGTLAALTCLIVGACGSNPQPARGVSEEPVSPASPDAPPATPAATAVAPQPPLRFEAVIRVDAEPGGKKLQGVWLERADGERWIVAYRPEPWLVAFNGESVEVVGSVYSPTGQAVSAPHFRIDRLKVADEAKVRSFASAGPERMMTGRFVDEVGAAGTKAEGEHSTTFGSDAGASYQLANTPDGLALGKSVEIRVREMTYSKHAAHRGGPMIWVLEIGGKPVGEAVAPAVKVAPPDVSYAKTSADLDGDGSIESITVGADGTVTVAGATARFDWIHPTDDYWGGLDRDQRLSILRLDATHQAVVFWQFREGDVDPDKQFHVWGYWDGTIRPLTSAPIEVGHAAEVAARDGILTFIDDGCVRDATILPDGTTANDGQARRTVQTLQWKAKTRVLAAGTKTITTRSRCLVAACPFVEVGGVRVGEILRRLSEPALRGTQSLRLPAFAGGRLEVSLVEGKPEVSFVDAVGLRVDGVLFEPLGCGERLTAACRDDEMTLRLGPGDRASFPFDLPASDDVVLVVDGHYVPLDH